MLEKQLQGFSRKTVATWEHIINDASIITRENIVRCCTSCNSSKGSKVLADWIKSDYCVSRGISEETVSNVVKAALKKSESSRQKVESFEIVSERLILRNFTASDFDQVHSYASDVEVVKYMEWGPNSRRATMDYIERAKAYAIESPQKMFELAIIEISTGKLIGGIGLHTANKQAMVGYCFSRSVWGKGYATEAASSLLSWGFSSLDIHRVWARCDSENKGSLRVLEKLGMRQEGLALHDCQIRGEWRNTFLFAVLAEEWNN